MIQFLGVSFQRHERQPDCGIRILILCPGSDLRCDRVATQNPVLSALRIRYLAQ